MTRKTSSANGSRQRRPSARTRRSISSTCRLFGHPTPAEDAPQRDHFAFEKGASKGKGRGWIAPPLPFGRGAGGEGTERWRKGQWLHSAANSRNCCGSSRPKRRTSFGSACAARASTTPSPGSDPGTGDRSRSIGSWSISTAMRPSGSSSWTASSTSRRRADESPGDARRQRHSFLECGGRGRPRIRAHADPRGAPGSLRLKRGPLTLGPSPMGEGGASRRLRLAGGDRDRGRPRPPPRPQPRTGKNRAPLSRTGKGPGEGAGRRRKRGAQNKKLDKIRIFGYQYSNGRNRAVGRMSRERDEATWKVG